MARAERLAGEAGLLLVVGTTLEVWPVGGLPERTRSAGGAVAIVNRGPTAFDESADLRIEGGAGVVLTALLDVLESQPI
jgi:NAD-dependent deacetylase